MAGYAGVEMQNWLGQPTGYIGEEEEMFNIFVDALPRPEVLRTIIAPNFHRVDGEPPTQTEEYGADKFFAFRAMIAETSAPRPDEPVRGLYIPRHVPEYVDPDKPGLIRVAGALTVPYEVTAPFRLPPQLGGEVLEPGTKYDLRVVEAVNFRPAETGDPDNEYGWVVDGRRAKFMDGTFPPGAIWAQVQAERAGQPWPPTDIVDPQNYLPKQ